MKAGSETGNIYDCSLVSALAYLLFLIERFYFEMQTTVFDPCHLAAERYTHADGRGGQVPHVHPSTDSVIAFVEERLHRIAGGHFEVADQVGVPSTRALSTPRKLTAFSPVTRTVDSWDVPMGMLIILGCGL